MTSEERRAERAKRLQDSKGTAFLALVRQAERERDDKARAAEQRARAKA